jgi:hypothetical protein
MFLSQGSWCKLDLSLTSELYQTFGDELFLLGIFLQKLAKQKICQIKYVKLLELLSLELYFGI